MLLLLPPPTPTTNQPNHPTNPFPHSESRQVIRDYEFYYDEPYIAGPDARYLKQHSIVKFDILVTTYETVIKDVKILSQIQWKVLVVDEVRLGFGAKHFGVVGGIRERETQTRVWRPTDAHHHHLYTPHNNTHSRRTG